MIKNILYKFLSLIVMIRYRKIPSGYFYYYRETYICQITQWKYLLKDYIFRPRYKEITYNGEFAPELQFALPFAYWHYKNGTLKATNSAKYTSELYFFSPHHSEIFEGREPEANYNFEMPRVLYSQNYNMSKWEPVPLKEHYKNDVYVFEKPILIIANRYNSEWNGPPISFYSVEALEFIISSLKKDYTVVYNRPRPQNITMDNSDIYDMDEFNWLNETHPEVVLMEDLFKENKANAKNFNHLQLMVYANADKFISIHGGTATLASYFGGTNLILSKQGPEHYFKCYQKLYPKFSGAKVLHAKTDDQVKAYILEYFVVNNLKKPYHKNGNRKRQLLA